MESYHTSVLLNESISGLAIQPAGVYVDCTFGGGGHAKAILAQLTTGKLIAFDQDAEAIANKPNDNRLIMVHGNFRYLQNYLRYEGFPKVNGILADLGVSGHHFDSRERGFSFRFDAGLDMRMNQNATLSAFHVVNEYPLERLIAIFRQYGELDNAGRLGHLIVNQRQVKPIQTIDDLKTTIEPATPQKAAPKYLAKVFQAIRIEVNQEMEALKEMLEQSADVLLPGGKLVVITYHSLEDRLVKNFMKNGMFEGQPEKDLYGNVKVPFKLDNRKVIVAGEKELDENSRSRSAKLRIAERL